MDDPALLKPMSRAFIAALRAHECLLLLRQAESLGLSFPDRKKAGELQAAIEDAGICEELISSLKRETFGFLSSLRTYVEGATDEAPGRGAVG